MQHSEDAHPQASKPLGCDCGHSHGGGEQSIKTYIPIAVSTIMLAIGILLDKVIDNSFFTGYVRIIWYLLAYLPVALPVMKEGWEAILQKDVFNEFTLMTVATVGAFCIKEYPEAVAVMLFYSIGELFQDRAVRKAQGNIKDLLDMRSTSALVLRKGSFVELAPENASIGDVIQVRVGEKVALDGLLKTSESSFDTSALTGESKPATYRQGDTVLAGMVNLGKVIEVEVQKKYADSSLSRILAMVQDATARKAKTELLIRRFARVYTPIVFALAVLLTVVPYFLFPDYVLSEWLYRSLVFLVISCPCALVLSVPLGYFGGIGAASRHGILFKGANYLDMMSKVNTVVMDKTGTLTKGVFKVQSVVASNISEEELLTLAKAIESQSTHPIAKAITDYIPTIKSDDSTIKIEASTNKPTIKITGSTINEVSEIAGYGLKGIIDGKEVLAGNTKLMKKQEVDYDTSIDSIVSSIVVFAVDRQYVGYITIADEVKDDSKELIDNLHKYGVTKVVMLSGDKDAIVQQVAQELGMDIAHGDLLPQDKLAYVEQLKADKNKLVAFVGDGINDTPVLALSDVGIAMGAMGSDAAIEVADVVIQTDQPSKVISAIRIGQSTNRIVMQNIVFAIVVKVLVLALGALGFADMWEAVFADVGVTLIAVLNSVRILKMKF